MITALPSGTYILALSGGVDSCVLLHMLLQQKNVTVIAAHFDHGIREDSVYDALFTQGLANTYGVQYELGSAVLGSKASEQMARTHRYAFLKQVQQKYNASAIITAHHLDDRIETAAINTLRGTMRRGLVSLRSTNQRIRPLLHMSKAEIYEYALQNKIEWQQDSTNASQDYLRNRVRATLSKTLSNNDKQRLTDLLNQIEQDNLEIEELIQTILSSKNNTFNRQDFNEIDPLVLFELVAQWLRNNGAVFDAQTIVRICNGAKKLQTGAKIDIDKRYYCQLTKKELTLVQR